MQIKNYSWKRNITKHEIIPSSISKILSEVGIAFVVLIIFASSAFYTFSPELKRIVAGQEMLLEKAHSTSDPIRKLDIDPKLLSSRKSISPTISQEKEISDEVIDTASSVSNTQESQTKTDTSEWGKAEQIGDYTWQIKVGSDGEMGSPNDVFVALNNYRKTHGKNLLEWNDTLANFASERAMFFSSRGSMDEHAGFKDFLDNQDGFNKLGFNSVGENSAYLSGGPLTGTHIIEWLYAADPLHDANQLESKWTHVGIGISGPAVDVIFGGKKQ